MRLIRVYTDAVLQDGDLATLTGSAANHVARVLRLRAGDAVTLFNGDGWDYPGRVRSLAGQRVEVELGARAPGLPESPLAVDLLQGVARGERMDLVVQKATELGVARILPVLAGRSVVRLDARQAQRKQAHWQAIAISACEQCGRSRVPVIVLPRSLAESLAEEGLPAGRFMLAPGAPVALNALAPGTAGVALLIGPEGGLTDAERAAASQAGFEPRALGPRILRTETAALVALVVLQSASGDLR
jgi:16S rRNA (uracil1498-N3)-methyltransferase